jgi:hypothetical protein
MAEGPKRTLQVASVIGREFTQRLVHQLSEIRERTDTLLHELKALELIREPRLLPELAYMFKHALTQDVAYSSYHDGIDDVVQARPGPCLCGHVLQELLGVGDPPARRRVHPDELAPLGGDLIGIAVPDEETLLEAPDILHEGQLD